jgi:hypothetical protein
MDVSKKSLEALYARRDKLTEEIKMHEKDLEGFPGSSFLGHFYLTKCIEYKQKRLEEVLDEIDKRKYE